MIFFVNGVGFTTWIKMQFDPYLTLYTPKNGTCITDFKLKNKTIGIRQQLKSEVDSLLKCEGR